MEQKGIMWGDVHWIKVRQERNQWQARVNKVITLYSREIREIYCEPDLSIAFVLLHSVRQLLNHK